MPLPSCQETDKTCRCPNRDAQIPSRPDAPTLGRAAQYSSEGSILVDANLRALTRRSKRMSKNQLHSRFEPSQSREIKCSPSSRYVLPFISGNLEKIQIVTNPAVPAAKNAV